MLLRSPCLRSIQELLLVLTHQSPVLVRLLPHMLGSALAAFSSQYYAKL